jgi:DNA-binding transcriptional LysR family regulator
VTLFDRSAYRIDLTDAGRAFAAEVARILGDVRNAVLIAKRAARSARVPVPCPLEGCRRR